MRTFSKGGVHPPGMKATAGTATADIPVPPQLTILTSQNIGAPSRPVVKPGDTVTVGQTIAEAGGYVGTPLHSPVNGKVLRIEPARTHRGLWQEAIVIQPDADNPLQSELKPRTQAETDALTPAEIREIIARSGIVGLGGAGFPTHVKLNVPEGKRADYLLINGAECEPCLTCDTRLMLENPGEIISGIKLLMRAAEAPRALVGIEDNKPECMAALREAAAGEPAIEVVPLRTKYPQGGEKQIIKALTGRTVPMGALPVDAGCVVDNVATAKAVHDAVMLRQPLTSRTVTVTGKGVERPGNYRVLLGTPIDFILDHCGGIPEDTGKIIAGGPMMGQAVSATGAGATKGLSGLVLVTESEAARRKPGPCIRCARCVEACPMGLEPYLLMALGANGMWDDLGAAHALNCIECGCCSYTCPSARPILDYIKLGKQELRKKR